MFNTGGGLHSPTHVISLTSHHASYTVELLHYISYYRGWRPYFVLTLCADMIGNVCTQQTLNYMQRKVGFLLVAYLCHLCKPMHVSSNQDNCSL